MDLHASIPYVAGSLLAAQTALMAVDELAYHRRRPLSAFEAIGHPVDTACFLAAVSVPALWRVPSPGASWAYAGLGVLSSLIITKDEWVHKRDCRATEQWLHSLLFVLHVPVIISIYLCWRLAAPGGFLQLVPLAVGAFLAYQLLVVARRFWRRDRPRVNNAFYNELGDRWYEDDGHAVAVLRAEAGIKAAYAQAALAAHGLGPGARILDVACGAGFVAWEVAAAGFSVKGVDLATDALAVAARRRAPGRYRPVFEAQDALALAEPTESYDAVLVLDFLEHIERPEAALAQAARVLKPGGIAVLHTFNRTPLARLLAVHALELLARDCPRHVHVYDRFIKPAELVDLAGRVGLQVKELKGIRPRVDGPFWRSALARRVQPGFGFCHSRSLAVGYIGHAVKVAAPG